MAKLTEKKRPFQIWWDDDTKKDFVKLVNSYDPDMAVAVAVLKLVKHAIQENWIPGYIRKEKAVYNKMAGDIKSMAKIIDNDDEV